ncbi:hypothetical protein Tco_1063783, partial [Tanacetum coccineum]
LHSDEVVVDVVAGKNKEQGTKIDEMEVSTAEVVTTASEAVTTVVKNSYAPTITVTTAVSTPIISKDELSLAETLIEIKAAKFKAITTAAITLSTRPKAKAVVFHEQEEQAAASRPVVSSAQSSKSKDKDSKVVKGSEAGIEESSKREGDKLESDMSKKQKVDEHVETEEHTDQEDEELKKHLEIVKDDEVAIEEIPLATKPLMIIEYKIVREGMMGHF